MQMNSSNLCFFQDWHLKFTKIESFHKNVGQKYRILFFGVVDSQMYTTNPLPFLHPHMYIFSDIVAMNYLNDWGIA